MYTMSVNCESSLLNICELLNMSGSKFKDNDWQNIRVQAVAIEADAWRYALQESRTIQT